MISLLKRLVSEVITPGANRAILFLNSATGEPSYKDSLGVVRTLKGTDGEDGEDGVDGVDAPIYSRRYSQSGNYQYVGIAVAGSSESDPVWTIQRLTYASGVWVITQTATGVDWTNRASHTYI